MFNLIILYYGLVTMLTQLVVFRELSVLFYGSELFLGTFLSSWLFWAGLGSFLARRLLKKEQTACPPVTDMLAGRRALSYFSYAFLAVSLLFPAMILLIRASKSAFPFGEFIGPVETILYTFSVMSALCFIIGGQFSLACAITADKVKKETAVGRVYLYEALGAVTGGVLFTYILIGSVPTFIIAVALSLGCIIACFYLLIKRMSLKKLLLIAAALAILFVNFRIEPAINRVEWKRYHFIGQKEARNATLSLVSMGSIKNVFMDGMLSASFPDPERYEPSSHWPLLASARPGRILIIGDASLGALKEALKHKPEKIDYVVLDNSFIDLVKPYLGREDISALEDPATRIHYVDARIFVRNSREKYDDVIMDMPEVPNLKTNRFYTEKFFGQIKSILKPDGILALGVASSENYLSPQTRVFNASVYRTLKSVFNTVEVIPGDTVTFLSSPSAINMRKETFLARFNARNISNHYVIPSHIEYKLEATRRAELKDLLDRTRGAEINRDFKPTTCYYFAGFWLNKFASPLGYLALGALFIAIVSVIFGRKRSSFFPGLRKEPVLIFILGFIGMLLELILLLGYQIVSGYVYWQMGVLFASFMSGVFLGSLLGNQFKYKARQTHFISLAILSSIIIGLSIGAAYILPRIVNLSAIHEMLVFGALLAAIGAVVGAAFVIAGFLIGGDEVMAKAGSLYSADLWGAGLGALLSANLIVPLFGILGALNFSAVMGSAGLAVFFILSGKDGV